VGEGLEHEERACWPIARGRATVTLSKGAFA
jgi:hypothetical protein